MHNLPTRVSTIILDSKGKPLPALLTLASVRAARQCSALSCLLQLPVLASVHQETLLHHLLAGKNLPWAPCGTDPALACPLPWLCML